MKAGPIVKACKLINMRELSEPPLIDLMLEVAAAKF